MSKRSLFLLAAVLLAAGTARAQDLNGAGATFPFPIYSKWFSDYATATGVKINYQSIGSGGGIRQFTAGTVDFGASDAPMSDEEMSKLPGPAFHIPTVLGAVVVTYNIPGYNGSLKLTGPVIADIFLGQDHEVERHAHHLAQQGREPPGDRHPRGAPLRRQRHDLHLHRLSQRREPGLGDRARQGEGSRVARRPRRQGQRRSRGPREADAGLDRLRRDRVREPEQDADAPNCRMPKAHW